MDLGVKCQKPSLPSFPGFSTRVHLWSASTEVVLNQVLLIVVTLHLPPLKTKELKFKIHNFNFFFKAQDTAILRHQVTATPQAGLPQEDTRHPRTLPEAQDQGGHHSQDIWEDPHRAVELPHHPLQLQVTCTDDRGGLNPLQTTDPGPLTPEARVALQQRVAAHPISHSPTVDSLLIRINIRLGFDFKF
jgi:hypothetical protein